jgi:hypothetical protein
MSRYSPTVLPDAGPDAGAQLVDALLRARQMRQQREDRVRTNRLADVEEYEHGVRHGALPGEEPSTITTTREVQDEAPRAAVWPTAREDFDPFAQGGAPRTRQVTETRANPRSEALAYALGGGARYQDLGHGYYVDRAATPAAQAASATYARNRDAYEQLHSADASVGAFIPGYDYTGPLAEALKTNQTIRVEGVKHSNDMERVGVEQAGQDRRNTADLGERRYEHETVSGSTRASVDEQRHEHDTPSGSTVYAQSHEDYRHDHPATGGPNGTGRAGMTWNQAWDRASTLLGSTQTRTVDASGNGTTVTRRDTAAVRRMAEQLYNGDPNRQALTADTARVLHRGAGGGAPTGTAPAAGHTTSAAPAAHDEFAAGAGDSPQLRDWKAAARAASAAGIPRTSWPARPR